MNTLNFPPMTYRRRLTSYWRKHRGQQLIDQNEIPENREDLFNRIYAWAFILANNRIDMKHNNPEIVPVSNSESKYADAISTLTRKKSFWENYLPINIIKKLLFKGTSYQNDDENNNSGDDCGIPGLMQRTTDFKYGCFDVENLENSDVISDNTIINVSSDIPGTIPHTYTKNQRIESNILKYILKDVAYTNIRVHSNSFGISSNIFHLVYITDKTCQIASYVVKKIFLLDKNLRVIYVFIAIFELIPTKRCIFFWKCVSIFVAVLQPYDIFDINYPEIVERQDDLEFLAHILLIIGYSLWFVQELSKTSIEKSTKLGEVLKKTGRIQYFLIQTVTLTSNFVVVVIFIYKSQSKEFAIQNIVQLYGIIIFFTKTLLNFKFASTIIKAVQHEAIDIYRNELEGDAEKLFNKHTEDLCGEDTMYGNAENIKFLNQNGIPKIKDLYYMMTNSNVDNSKVKLTNKGYVGVLNVNGQLKIHPLKLLENSEEERNFIYKSTKNLTDGLISQKVFLLQTKYITKQYKIYFECGIAETIKKICDIFDTMSLTDIVVNDCKIFVNATDYEIIRMGEVLSNTLQNDKELLKIATNLARINNCKSIAEFIPYIEFTGSAFSEKIKSIEKDYQDKLGKEEEEPNFSRTEFDKNYGIIGRRNKYFRGKAIEMLSSENGLNEELEKITNLVGPLNQKQKIGFTDDKTAAYHFHKHRNFGERELTAEEYFKIGLEVIENKENLIKAMLTQDGTCLKKNYRDEKQQVFVVEFIKDGCHGLATVFYDPIPKN